jgi:light-regulated signal transduction histidine kinase (bacteriophytochrome)
LKDLTPVYVLRICGLEQVQWQGRTDVELTRLSRTGRVLPTASSQTKVLDYDANELSRCEETLNDSDGTARTFEFVTNQVGGALGRMECVIVIGREVTHFKRAERIQQHQMEVIRRLNDELESRVAARTAALETANRELEAFSYSVSHDLRAPLRALNGFSRLLEEDFGDRLSGEAIVYLERIRRAAERMGELIDDLLKLSRISRAQIKRQPFDLSVAAKAILDELGEAESLSRRFDFVIQEGLHVEADAGLVRVLLENLLRNAWKFSRRSDPTRIEFGRIIRRGRPYYFVRDNGAGFDMEHASRLFAPFQRLHSQDEYEGSGIGLAIVQRIVRLHGGEVEAESRAGAGATFYFSLSIPELDAAYQWDTRC